MGPLKAGTPLTWAENKEHMHYIRRHGVLQFLNTFHRLKELEGDRLFYGDEIEYHLIRVDPQQRKVQISLRSPEALERLRACEQSPGHEGQRGAAWHQEYGSWMIEGTPKVPYGGYTASLLQVEQNMRLRRARLLSALEDNEIAPTVVTFPLMGVEGFVHPPTAPGGPYSESSTIPDACINPHPRFGTLTANIRKRRGSKVDIRVPLFRDKKTPEFAKELPAGETPSIHMDCMAYGMGCCCLQVTFQCSDMDESRYLYDQFTPLAPVMLALTAASPIWQGRVSGTDVRWRVISGSVDDRTPAERGEGTAAPDPTMAGGGVRRQYKSRYDSVSTYIHPKTNAVSSKGVVYNDVPCPVDEELEAFCRQEGLDEPLAHHIAHLFTRDPLVAFEGSITEVDDKASTEHFESIQSTNWQTVRWKPPPPRPHEGMPHIGWRTEFRPMEVQLTDFENAAFTAFIVIVTRALLVFDLCLVAPLSKVDENMSRAHAQDAVLTQKFWFRKDILPDQQNAMCSPDSLDPECSAPEFELSENFEEMTVAEIMTGRGTYFPGLIPLCYAYLEHIGCDSASMTRIDEYLQLVKKRATGELPTAASWMRKFVQEHKDYKQDSVVSQEIAFDLLQACNEIGLGRRACPELLGSVTIEPIVKEGIYEVPLRNEKLGTEDRASVLRKYVARAAYVDGPGSAPSPHFLRRQVSPLSLHA